MIWIEYFNYIVAKNKMKPSFPWHCLFSCARWPATSVAILLAVLLSASMTNHANAAEPAATLESCDSHDFQSILHAAPDRFEARAYWLTRRLLKWPGIQPGGNFRIYYSSVGRISAKPRETVSGADGWLAIQATDESVPPAVLQRFHYVPEGVLLTVQQADLSRVPDLLRQQLVLARLNPQNEVEDATALQAAGALDDQYAAAGELSDLGITFDHQHHARFKLWAPTARQVSLCIYASGAGSAVAVDRMRFDPTTGTWAIGKDEDLSGRYYRYLVDVHVPGVGMVRNLVTDPYSISLTTDSRRSYIGDLDSAALKPSGWDKDTDKANPKVSAQTDMTVYEMHVRDFSINDPTVPPAHRGKFMAFTDTGSNGMRHLLALSRAGLTDIHLLPAFDFGSVPEQGCVTPRPHGDADSESQQEAVMAVADRDCFNWGYDPYHYNAPEGSYATDPADGAVRIREFRQMVLALHKIGLRVGMDVVYNHTFAAGQKEKSVLDRIVPGYYHRLDSAGRIEQSTCCDNTATENMMMGKLMLDSTALWAKEYRIDSFRFDLMAHQPRAAMETLQARVDAARGRHVNLIGEGWNFGEVANGARFVQASQLSLNGSGIGTFNDRLRDAVRGGGAADNSAGLIANQGYINGLVYAPNALADPIRPPADLLQQADMVRAGMAGSLRDFELLTYQGTTKRLQQIAYGEQPAGYVSQPGEVVNYVENHDNQTLFDINAYRLPLETSREDRARVQMLGAAIVAFSQGVAYFHAGIDTLRSKSMDANSFNSGDWFNRLDWSYADNYFGSGAPPKADNDKNYALIKPLLRNPSIKPTAAEIGMARDLFRDLLRIRASSTLFRLPTASEIEKRLRFYNTGATQTPTVIAARLDGAGLVGAGFKRLIYFINVAPNARELDIPDEKGQAYQLHPVQAAAGAADKRAAAARYDSATGKFQIPARSAVVFVVP